MPGGLRVLSFPYSQLPVDERSYLAAVSTVDSGKEDFEVRRLALISWNWKVAEALRFRGFGRGLGDSRFRFRWLRSCLGNDTHDRSALIIEGLVGCQVHS